jgi:hypothetical protein
LKLDRLEKEIWMKSKKKKTPAPDKKLAAACGLFCPACIVFMASRETPENREKLSRSLAIPLEKLHCDGCRSEKRFSFCLTCKLIVCADKKGVDFCGACADFPCNNLKEFQGAKPHRLELWSDQGRIQEVGYEKWFAEMLEHYACPQCGALNSAYHVSCRECGATPGNAFVAAHKEAIIKHLAAGRAK